MSNDEKCSPAADQSMRYKTFDTLSKCNNEETLSTRWRRNFTTCWVAIYERKKLIFLPPQVDDIKWRLRRGESRWRNQDQQEKWWMFEQRKEENRWVVERHGSSKWSGPPLREISPRALGSDFLLRNMKIIMNVFVAFEFNDNMTSTCLYFIFNFLFFHLNKKKCPQKNRKRSKMLVVPSAFQGSCCGYSGAAHWLTLVESLSPRRLLWKNSDRNWEQWRRRHKKCNWECNDLENKSGKLRMVVPVSEKMKGWPYKRVVISKGLVLLFLRPSIYLFFLRWNVL